MSIYSANHFSPASATLVDFRPTLRPIASISSIHSASTINLADPEPQATHHAAPIAEQCGDDWRCRFGVWYLASPSRRSSPASSIYEESEPVERKGWRRKFGFLFRF